MSIQQISPYLDLPIRPLHCACAETWRSRGGEPPCEGCPLADLCARERVRNAGSATDLASD